MRRIIALFAVLILASATAQAITLGVGPAKLEFKGAKRGETYNTRLTASTTDDLLHCQVTASGDAADWIRLDDKAFELSARSQHAFPVSVTVPESTPNGVYTAVISVRAAPGKADLGGTGMNVGAAIHINTIIEVGGAEGAWFRVLNVTVDNAVEGDPIRTDINIKNNAFRDIKPTISIRAVARDGGKAYAASSLARETVESMSRKTLTTYLPSTQMGADLYAMEVKVNVEGKSIYESSEPFYVLPKGAQAQATFKLEGALDDAVVSNANLTLGESATVKATFRNPGDVPLYATLRMDILKGGETVSTEEGPGEYVEPSQTKKMNLTYKPPTTGEYTARIWVEYSGLRTAVREARIIAWTEAPQRLNLDINFNVIAATITLIALAWAVLYYWKYYAGED